MAPPDLRLGRTTKTGIPARPRVLRGKVVPITRRQPHYLEPTPHALQRKNAVSGSKFGRYRNRGWHGNTGDVLGPGIVPEPSVMICGGIGLTLWCRRPRDQRQDGRGRNRDLPSKGRIRTEDAVVERGPIWIEEDREDEGVPRCAASMPAIGGLDLEEGR